MSSTKAKPVMMETAPTRIGAPTAAGRRCGDGILRTEGDAGGLRRWEREPRRWLSLIAPSSVVTPWSTQAKPDDGNPVETDACLSSWPARCGDGVLYIGVEDCDDGNQSTRRASARVRSHAAATARLGGREACDTASTSTQTPA